MHKSIKYIVLSIVIVALLVSNVSAWADSIIINNGGTQTGQTDMHATHPSADADGSAVSVTFNGTGYTLDVVTFKLAKVGSPSGTLRVALYTSNSTGHPDELIEYGSTKTMQSCTTNPTFTDYNFTFTGTAVLGLNIQYVILLYVQDCTTAYPNYVRVAGTAVSTSIVSRSYSYSVWAALEPTIDLYFIMYGSTADEGDSPLPDWTTDDTSELIQNVMEFLVPLVIMLLPAILFIIFFKKTDKWLILIGLAIGTGLGYYFGMVPVWLVFLVAIGLIGLAYSEVRRNG